MSFKITKMECKEKMIRQSSLLLVLVLSLFSGLASAITVDQLETTSATNNIFDLGPLIEPGKTFGAHHEHQGWFRDEWTFSLSELSNVALRVDNVLELAEPDTWVDGELVVNLLNINDLHTHFSFQLGAESEWVYATLDVGNYFFVVEGGTDGSLGGMYAGTVSVAAVPLPAAALLFGSALLGLFGVRARSRKA